MANIHSVNVMGITADDHVKMVRLQPAPMDHMVIDLPGNVTLFFEGRGAESKANLLGFLDQMHSIRNALMDDISSRSTTEA